MEETVLIRRASEGDTAAFARLVQTYQTPVYNLAYRILGERMEAEDAAQETFVRAFRNLHRYDPDRSFKTWSPPPPADVLAQYGDYQGSGWGRAGDAGDTEGTPGEDSRSLEGALPHRPDGGDVALLVRLLL